METKKLNDYKNDTPLEDLEDLHIRAKNCLIAADVRTFGEVMRFDTKKAKREMRNFGPAVERIINDFHEDYKEVYEKNCAMEKEEEASNKEVRIVWGDSDCEFFKSCITMAISAGRDISNEENLEKLIQDCEKLVNGCIAKMDNHDISSPHRWGEKLTRKENKILAGLVKSAIR